MHNRVWALRALSAAGADLSEPVLCMEKDHCALLASSVRHATHPLRASAAVLTTTKHHHNIKINIC